MSKHLDYAEALLKNGKNGRARMDSLFQSYNGERLPNSTKWLEARYGKKNVASFQSYKVGRTKLNLLHGEWLKRPLSTTVTTTDSDAMSDKMRQQDLLVGAVLAKKSLIDVKEKAGVDVMEGMEIPDSIDVVFEKMSPKDKQETIMQIILDNQVPELDAKKKLADCFLNMLITSMCYLKLELDQTGDVKMHVIDPRDAIYEEIAGDDYLQRSPILGCRQVMTVQEILSRYNLSDTDRNKLEAARHSRSDFLANNKGFRESDGQIVADVIHIEWTSIDPLYYKKSPKTKTQMELFPDREHVTLDMDYKSYETNPEVHLQNEKKGEYEVETKGRQCKYEATRIAGCIDVNMRKKPYQAIDIDQPSKVLDSTYHGFICGTVDGQRVSLQQMIYNLDMMYDIVMYQQNKALARAKGKALFYDRAGMPGGKSMPQIWYQIDNDGHIDYNSAADGNLAGAKLDPVNAIKEIDLGLSQSFQYLNEFKMSIVNDMNQLTGINNDREGQIAASSTATNANSAINASRTITEPLFYGMNGFVERVMQSVVDTTAVSWAFFKTEKGEQILGSQKYGYLQVTKELGYRNYGVRVEDGSKFTEMKQYAKEMIAISLNAKEIRPVDAWKVMFSETMSQMNTTLINSWQEMQAVVQKSQTENNRVQQEIAAMKEQNTYKMNKENVEDAQRNEKDNILLDGDMKIKIDNNKARNKISENHHKIVNENIFSKE